MTRIIGLLLLCIASSTGVFADLFVSLTAPGVGVERYTDAGVFLGTIIPGGAGGLTEAQGAAIGPNGDIFVGDFNNDNILRFSPTGTFLGVFASGAGINTPFDLVFGPDGNMYVANAGGLNTIAQLDPVTGAVLNPSFTSGNVTPIGGPQYIEFGPTLAITDIAGHLFLFDPVTGVHIQTIGGLDNPEGVAFNKAGDLFVAQRISDNVLRFSSGGGPAEVVIDSGDFGGAAADLEFGPNGLLYVLSTDAVYRFDVSGAKGMLVDSFGSGGEFLVFATPVPEPGTALFAVLAIAAFGVRRRFRGC